MWWRDKKRKEEGGKHALQRIPAPPVAVPKNFGCSTNSVETAEAFFASALASMAVQSVVFVGVQTACANVLRVSCATPVISTLIGGATVALASVASGATARVVQSPDFIETITNVGNPAQSLRSFRSDASFDRLRREASSTWSDLKRGGQWRDDVVMDAGLGLLLFAAFGGRFRSFLPSDVRYPGANASASLPAVHGAAYATKFQRDELLRLMRRYGCHHCGSKRGTWLPFLNGRGSVVIADHMPPNKTVEGFRQAATKRRFVGWLRMFLSQRRWNGMLAQRFYPQCQRCSAKQSAAVRMNRKHLVHHFTGWQPGYVAGLLVSMKNHMGQDGSSSRSRRRNQVVQNWRRAKSQTKQLIQGRASNAR